MSDAVDDVFILIEEGVPTDVIVERIKALSAPERHRFAEHLRVYRDNVLEDRDIPVDIVDDDGLYGRMRRLGAEVVPRIDAVLARLAGMSTS